MNNTLTPPTKKVSFRNAYVMKQLHPDTFEIPNPLFLQNFCITQNHFPELDRWVRVCADNERFWCKVISININTQTITASVDNDLITDVLKYGDVVEIQFCEIYDTNTDDNELNYILTQGGDRQYEWAKAIRKNLENFTGINLDNV